MALNRFFVGDYVRPRNEWIPFGRAVPETGPFTIVDWLVDASGHRTTLGQVVSVSSTPISFTIRSWNSKTSDFDEVTSTEFVYEVRVWDVGLSDHATYEYAESTIEPYVSATKADARHVDKSNMPPDVAELAEAARAIGEIGK